MSNIPGGPWTREGRAASTKKTSAMSITPIDPNELTAALEDETQRRYLSV